MHPIGLILLDWYEKNRRELPWRETSDPYFIWISEIILQQTRVQQGWDYFLRFTRAFPDVQTLASASEHDVLKLWQGLGYYSRARNLHAAAKQIVSQFNGVFPSEYEDILSLKGVGEYTAAAIASIAFNLPYAVVDGNVNRVISRLFAVETPINTAKGKKTITEIAQSLLLHEHAGTYNQAMMDFGSLICTPAQPKCEECPLQTHCMAYTMKKVSEFPVKNRKKSVRNRYFVYLHIRHRNKTYLQKRNKSDIWKNLYEFPLIELEAPTDFVKLQQTREFKTLFNSLSHINIKSQKSFKHVLSHQVIYADFYEVSVADNHYFELKEPYISVPESTLGDYPVSRLIAKYLETI